MPCDHGSLLQRCIRRDRAAQFELYRLMRDMLLSVARRYEPDPQHCRAMVNAAFLKILDKLHTRDAACSFEGWCRRIMINTMLNHLRDTKAAQPRTFSLDPAAADAFLPYCLNEAEEHFEADDLQRMLDRLPAMSRKVFNLHAIDGWKHVDIAVELGISMGTSKWHVNHARQLLKRMLAEASTPITLLHSA